MPCLNVFGEMFVHPTGISKISNLHFELFCIFWLKGINKKIPSSIFSFVVQWSIMFLLLLIMFIITGYLCPNTFLQLADVLFIE